ncbi:hypothetical protein [Lentibacillus sediminis]|nr:hypothetical protein [Lentibacillus sediminis]
MKKKKKDDGDMNAINMNPKKQSRKDKVQASFEKADKANGKALEKLSKN